MVHPQDWGKGPMQEIATADIVIKYGDEKGLDPEVLKDRGTQLDKSADYIRVIFIDPDNNRHTFVGSRVRRENS